VTTEVHPGRTKFDCGRIGEMHQHPELYEFFLLSY